MSDDKMHSKLAGLSKARVELPKHQHDLRARLMIQHARQHVSQNWFASIFKILHLAKENINIMKASVKIASFTGIAVALTVTALALTGISNPDPVSAAQEQLKHAWTSTQELDPQEKAELEQRLGADVERRLKEGAQAKDARFLSKDEFKQIAGIDPEDYKSELKAKDPSVADIKSFVTFKGSDGMRTVIAVDKNNQPLLVLAAY